MPNILKSSDGSVAVRLYMHDLTMEAVEEIDAELTTMGLGILYDHIIEEFGIADIEIIANQEELDAHFDDYTTFHGEV